MKNLITIFSLIVISLGAKAQHTEYNVMGGSGLFHYITKGKEEPYYSMINMTASPNYANNPYGNRNGISFQFSFELKKITKHPYLWGINLEYEIVQSKKVINWVYGPYNQSSSYDTLQAARGNCRLSNYYLSFNPYMGHRFFFKNINLDLMGGLDIAISTAPAHQQGSAIIKSNRQTTNYNIRSKNTDGYDPFEVRARLQTEVGYKKWGLYLGYSGGFYKGHLATMGGTPLYSFSRYFRAGILYRLK